LLSKIAEFTYEKVPKEDYASWEIRRAQHLINIS
jgi:hypothetical protein